MQLSGLGDKVAVVTGAGRMRSIGRPIAVELAVLRIRRRFAASVSRK